MALRFKYRAIDQGTGKKLTGSVEALNVPLAIKLLNDRGLLVVNLAGEGQGILNIFSRFGASVGLGELAAFTRQLATMVTAGITITESLSIARDQVGQKFSPIVEQILSDVESGSSLSQALERHPKIFTPVYVALVRAGETGGILDEVLSRLADNIEKQREFRSKVVGALVYPVIIVIGMIVVALIMIIVVVPRLSQIYSEFQAQLPLPTRILIFISSALTKFWWIIVLLLLFGVWGFTLFKKTAFGRRKIDELSLKIPVSGSLSQHFMLTEFTRTLGLLIGTGVSILESLETVLTIAGNEVFSRAIKNASRDVERGLPLAYALGQQSEVFPIMISRMIAVGEETGKLDEVLSKVSRILEVESETKIRALTSAIEPIIMIILGVGVGFLVVSIILPIYNLTSQF